MTTALFAYRALTGALSPFLPLLLKQRVRRGKEDGARLQERLGYAFRRRPAGQLVWLHGASIGESQVLLQLFESLRKEAPDLQGVITTQTMTSAELIARKAIDGLIHQMAPLDTVFATERFLKHWTPDLAIFAEGDIWPNMLTKLDAKRIPRMLVNARMTEKSFNGWMRFPKLAGRLFGGFQTIHAANQKTGDWLKVFSRNRARYTGNIKHSAPPLRADMNELEKLKTIVGERAVLAAISTHPGEEEIVVEAYKALRAEMTEPPLLILAPRHPERGDELAQTMLGAFSLYQRSKGGDPAADQSVWLCDTLGEVGLWMRLSDVVFLGGGLPGSDIFGHNPIEALKLDRHVISLPEVDNFKREFADLVEGGAADLVENADDIKAVALPFLTREKQFETTGTRLNAYLSGDAPLIQARDAALRNLGRRPGE